MATRWEDMIPVAGGAPAAQPSPAPIVHRKPIPVDAPANDTPAWSDLKPIRPAVEPSTAPQPSPTPTPTPSTDQDSGRNIEDLIAGRIPSARVNPAAPGGHPGSTVPYGPETIQAPPPRSLLDRFLDNVSDTVNHYSTLGVAGLTRLIAGALPSTSDWSGVPGADNSQAAQQARARARVTQQERDWRELAAGRDAQDPIIRPGDSWYAPGSIARGAAALGGGMAGGLASDPTTLIAPGKTLLSKMIGQAAVGGLSDAAQQGVEIGEGTRDTFDPTQSAMNATGGAALVGLMHGAPALREWWKSRGANVDKFTDDQLVSASLDGGIDGQPRAPSDLDAIIRSAGAAPEQFSTPDAAARAGERIQQRLANPSPNLAENVAALSPSEAPKLLDSLIAARGAGELPTRTIPDATQIIAAPEGNIRSDDAGAMAGLERKRAADQGVMTQAQQRVADDPVVGEILSSNVSPQTKVRVLWDRISKTGDDIRNAPIPDAGPDAPLPWTEPTPARARATGRGGDSFDRMLGVESGRRQFAEDGSPMRSSKGATGIAQVMPATGPEAARLAGLPWDEKRFQTDPAYNEALGRAYHDEMLRRFDGDEALAAAAYNAGPGRVEYALEKGGRMGWLDYVPQETRDYVRKVFGGKAPEPRGPSDLPMRVQAPDNMEGEGYFSAASEVPRDPTDPRAGPVHDNFNQFEDIRRPTSPSAEELAAGKVYRTGQRGDRFTDTPTSAPFEPRMQSGYGDRPFRAAADDPAGRPGFWEDRANQLAAEHYAQAQADLEAEWARRREEQAQRRANAGADDRFTNERTQTGPDPQAAYAGKYDQRPVMDGEFWAVTPDGYVAGKTNKPVAFRSAREAAQWAAKNAMGGDFELHSYGSQDRAGNQRIVLRRREGSSYGQQQPPITEPVTPAEPPAGRSTDTSQRALPAPPAEPAPSAQPVEAGSVPPAPPRQSPAPVPAASREPLVGAPQQVVTPRGRAIDTRFEVHEARDLIDSAHPAYDQRIQPRDRASRVSSDAQVADIASRLDPEQLHQARLASHGAPIVGPDRMVESGNGRVAAIRRAYELHPDRAAEYRAMIERQGFDTTGMKEPVLVRRRTSAMTDEERAAFAREGQDDGTMEMSRAEKVRSDAAAMSPDTLKLYRGGDVASAGNRDFVRRWMDDVIQPSERNALVRPDGTLSAEGIQRLRGTLLAKAFDDPDLVEKIVSDPNSEIRAIGTALTEAAPAFAELKARIADGNLPPEFDITPQVGEVARLIARARAEGKSVGDLLKQNDMFTGETDPTVKAVAGIMFRNGGFRQPRSAQAVADGLRFYTDEAAKQAEARAHGNGLFGDEKAVTPLEIAQAARERLILRDEAARGDSSDLFAKRQGVTYSRSSAQSLRSFRNDLEGIAASDRNPEYRRLANVLADLVGDDALVAYGRRFVGAFDRGIARPGENFAAVKRFGDTETTLHEAIHLAAMSRYGWEFDRMHPGDLAASPVHEFLSLFNDAREAFKREGGKLLTGPDGIRYALSSPDEFLSMALTNRSTQQFLQRGTLWTRLVDGVRKLLGLAPRFKPMLDDVLSAANRILDAAGEDPKRGYDAGGRTGGEALDTRSRPGFFKAVADTLYDGDEIARDFEKFRAAIKDPIETLKNVTAPMRNTISGLVFSNDGVLRTLAARFKSDAINDLADHFVARAGKGDGTERTYHEAVQLNSVSRVQQTAEALKPFLDSPASLDRIRRLLTHPNDKIRAAPAEIKAATELRDLLKQTIDYRKAAGEDIGEVADGYFPRVLDVAKVSKNRDDFLRRAEKLYQSIGVDDPKGAADAWFARAFDTYSGLDGGLDQVRRGGGGMGGNTAKGREFGKQADELMRPFYHDDVFQTLASYFVGSARRAEEARRFGPKGAVGSAERDAWVKEHGDKTQMDVLNDRIKADVLASGKDAGDLLHRLKKAVDANLGRLGSVSHNTRAMISYAHAWNQLSKMDRTTVTSLGELTMGFIRGGPRFGFSYIKDTAVEFARELAGAHPSDAKRWAEAIGVAQDALVNQSLTTRISADGSTQGVQKVLAGYYKAILLHQFTESERIAATRMGRHYLGVLAGDMQSPKARVRARAGRYLQELGVSDPKAFGDLLRNGEPSLDDVRRDAPGLASDYTTALIRFVNQTVIAPNRGEKPWLSAHPVGSLFTSLLGYNYGFKKNVLDRAGRLAIDAVKDRDPLLLAPAAMLPIMAVFQYYNDTYLRAALYGSNYDFSTETPSETALRVADRAGFTGPLSPVINAFKGIKYRRSLAETAAGTVAGSALADAGKIAEPWVGNNSPNTNAAERNSAAALYDAVVEPAIDASAAKYLKGIPRSAVVLGTGNKRGGLMPGDKDAFVDTVAGPQQ